MHKYSLQPWQTLGESIALQTPWFTIKKYQMRTPSGVDATYYIHENKDAVICVCVNDKGNILIERQYRPPVSKISVDYPGGRVEQDDHSTEKALRRELQEETGYTVNSIQKLGVIDRDPSFTSGRLHVYLAQDLTPGKATPEETENIITEFVSPTTILKLIASGEMACSFCLSATLLAFQKMEWETKPI